MKFLEESVEKKLKRRDSKLKSKWLLAKRALPFFLGIVWICLLTNYIFTSVKIQTPSAENPIISYYEENGSDLKYLYCALLQGAQRSIFYSSFGLSDRDVLRILKEKKQDGLLVTFHNSKKQKALRKKTSGLYHRKFLIIDDEKLFLGSANCSIPSLCIDGNQIFGFSNKELIRAIKNNESFEGKDLSLYLLPGDKKIALQKLLERIQESKEKISIAMYALTHPQIIEEIIHAHERGVKITIYLDRGMANGTCKKYLAPLLKKNIPIFLRAKGGLNHHKCAQIDDTYLFGSANWTRAGFSKNEETFVIINNPSNLLQEQIDRFFQNQAYFSTAINN